MRNGEGIAGDRGKFKRGDAEKSTSSNSPGLSLLGALAGCPLNLHRYPMLCFWRKGDRGVIVGVSGEKSGETNGPGGKWPLEVVAATMKFVEMGVDDGDETEMVGESGLSCRSTSSNAWKFDFTSNKACPTVKASPVVITGDKTGVLNEACLVNDP